MYKPDKNTNIEYKKMRRGIMNHNTHSHNTLIKAMYETKQQKLNLESSSN